MRDVQALHRLLVYYSEQGRTINSITNLCGRNRKTIIKHSRLLGISFPDLRRANTKGESV